MHNPMTNHTNPLQLNYSPLRLPSLSRFEEFEKVSKCIFVVRDIDFLGFEGLDFLGLIALRSRVVEGICEL